MHRRTFVATASTATAIGLAGCIGGGGGGGSGSPEGAVEALYNAESGDDLEDYFHPESEFLNASEGNESEGNESANDEIETQLESTEVIAEDVDGNYLEDESYNPLTMSIEKISSIAEDEELAIVEATEQQSGNESTGSGSGTVTYLTATDGGDWYVLDVIFQLEFGQGS